MEWSPEPGVDYGMLMRISTGNAVGWCSREEALVELVSEEDSEDNRDLVWLPYDESQKALTVEDLPHDTASA